MSTHKGQLTLSQLSTNCRWSEDEVSIKCQSRCWLSVSLESTECWSRWRQRYISRVDRGSFKGIDWQATIHAFTTCSIHDLDVLVLWGRLCVYCHWWLLFFFFILDYEYRKNYLFPYSFEFTYNKSSSEYFVCLCMLWHTLSLNISQVLWLWTAGKMLIVVKRGQLKERRKKEAEDKKSN